MEKRRTRRKAESGRKRGFLTGRKEGRTDRRKEGTIRCDGKSNQRGDEDREDFTLSEGGRAYGRSEITYVWRQLSSSSRFDLGSPSRFAGCSWPSISRPLSSFKARSEILSSWRTTGGRDKDAVKPRNLYARARKWIAAEIRRHFFSSTYLDTLS